jgi:hypothetical protein
VTWTVCQGINQRMRLNSIMARETSRTIQTFDSPQMILVQFHNILIAFRFVLSYYTAAGCLTFGRILLQLNCGVKDFATCKLGLEPLFSKLLVSEQVYVASKGYDVPIKTRNLRVFFQHNRPFPRPLQSSMSVMVIETKSFSSVLFSTRYS